MGDHFWPAMYPGLIAGILVGLAFGGWLATIGGAVGGLIGAAVAFNLATLAGVSNDFIVLAVLLAGAACGAYIAIAAVHGLRRVTRR